LLPGSLVSLTVYHFYRNPINNFLDIGEANTGFYMSFAMLFSSYLFGHIINQLSAYQDEWVYDNFKEKIYYKSNSLEKVKTIRKEKFLNSLNPVYVNTYKWSLYKLQKEYAEAASEVNRYMADSKFFRSLVVVLLAGLFIMAFTHNSFLGIIAGMLLVVFVVINMSFDNLLEKQAKRNSKNSDRTKNVRQVVTFIIISGFFLLISYLSINHNPALGLGLSLLAAFSMVRYFKKRWKSTETAYQYIIFLEELNTRKDS